MDAYSDDEWKDSDDEEVADKEQQQFIVQTSYVLIAIDVDKEMFAASGSDNSAFLQCLQACFELYNSLVLADRGSVKGPVAIVLANNETSRATFIDFEQPIPDSVKLLKNLKDLTNEELEQKYLRKGDFDLGDFFLFCKNKLSSISGGVYKRTVYYITNNADPTSNDAKKRFKIINESQKFAALQINLFVVTFKSDFDNKHLYSDVLAASNSPSVEIIKDATSLTSRISDFVKRRFTKYRIKFYPFVGDSESYLNLVINKFVKSANTVKNMYVTRDTQKEVKKVTKVQPGALQYSCTYSNKLPPVLINALERNHLTETNIPTGLSLLHVADQSFRKGWIIETPELIEKHYKETKIVFDAFWQFCKDHSKCLVCLRKYRRGGELRVLELVPKFVNDKRMFLGLVYPFSTDIHYERATAPDVKFTDEEHSALTSFVDALTFDFNPRDFSDPVEAKRRAYIKSQLLDEPLEEIRDRTPSDDVLDRQIHNFVNEFRRLDLIDVSGKRTGAPKAARAKKAKKN